MATGLLTQACIAQALQDMTAAEKSAVCASLACTPAALNQSPGTGATVPTTAPASGASPFFVQTPSNLLHVWNGAAYVAITAAGGGGGGAPTAAQVTAALATLSGASTAGNQLTIDGGGNLTWQPAGSGGGAPTSAQVATAMCAASAAAFSVDSEIKVVAGQGAACGIKTISSSRTTQANLTSNQVFAAGFSKVQFGTASPCNFGSWNAANDTFTFNRNVKATVSANLFITATFLGGGSTYSPAMGGSITNNAAIVAVDVMSGIRPYVAGDQGRNISMTTTRIFAASDQLSINKFADDQSGGSFQSATLIGSAALQNNCTIVEII